MKLNELSIIKEGRVKDFYMDIETHIERIFKREQKANLDKWKTGNTKVIVEDIIQHLLKDGVFKKFVMNTMKINEKEFKAFVHDGVPDIIKDWIKTNDQLV